MKSLHLCIGQPSEIDRRLVAQVYEKRADIFDRHLGWIKTGGDYEIDYYDTINPIYIIWAPRITDNYSKTGHIDEPSR